mmetsp:Transcript_34144/g.87509  ORF Transcript_34144/g.87509 Transcript_34144/m.87509 type:complete len:212 (-) Transcript_34144:139-774(-)
MRRMIPTRSACRATHAWPVAGPKRTRTPRRGAVRCALAAARRPCSRSRRATLARAGPCPAGLRLAQQTHAWTSTRRAPCGPRWASAKQTRNTCIRTAGSPATYADKAGVQILHCIQSLTVTPNIFLPRCNGPLSRTTTPEEGCTLSCERQGEAAVWRSSVALRRQPRWHAWLVEFEAASPGHELAELQRDGRMEPPPCVQSALPVSRTGLL